MHIRTPRATKTGAAIATLAIAALLAACTSGGSGDTTTQDAGSAPDTTAQTEEPAVEPTGITPEPPVLDDYVTPGKITFATSEPAFSPWVENDDPASGEGFEAAVAYAVAEQMGFAKEDVVWVRADFNASIQPGPKDFDLNLQQFSITPERQQVVDFSTPYYTTSQVAITISSSQAAGASSLADLKGMVIGAMTGTTSLEAINASIQPDNGAQVFNSNDDAKLALQNRIIDVLVVDLPTAFFMVGAELDGGIILGQLPDSAGGDEFGILLEKDSPLTATVSQAVDALRDGGTLAQLEETWLGGANAAPVLQ
jgi:polar amino acid transport system substrate-binding protein